jgi:hypothetical protein
VDLVVVEVVVIVVYRIFVVIVVVGLLFKCGVVVGRVVGFAVSAVARVLCRAVFEDFIAVEVIVGFRTLVVVEGGILIKLAVVFGYFVEVCSRILLVDSDL